MAASAQQNKKQEDNKVPLDVDKRQIKRQSLCVRHVARLSVIKAALKDRSNTDVGNS